MNSTKPQGVRMIKFAPVNLRANYDETFATLSWAVRMGYPRVTVYLDNDKFDKKVDYSKIINAPFDFVKLEAFLLMVDKLIDSNDVDKEYAIKCSNNAYEGGERTNKIVLQATLFVGKDKDGVIYMKLVEQGKREVKFNLDMSGRYIALVGSDGQDIEDRKALSKLHAKAYFKTLRTLLKAELTKSGSKLVTLAPPKSGGYQASSYGRKQEKAPEKTPGIDTGDDLILDDM